MRHLALLLALLAPPVAADQVVGEIVSGIYVRGEMSTGTVAVLSEPPTGLVGWWDPDVPSAVHASGSNVQALDNLASGNFNCSLFGGTPLLTADAINGNDCIDYESTETDYLYSATAALTGPPICVMSVVSLETRDNRNIFALGTNGSNNNRFLLLSGISGLVTWNCRTTADQLATGTNVSNGVTTVFYGEEASSTSRRVQTQGANEGTNSTSATPSAPNRTIIGAGRDSGTTPFDGLIGPTVLWNVVESASKTRVERWLGARFGVSVP